MVLNVHRNHETYYGRGEARGREGVGVGESMEVGEERDYISVGTLSPTE